MSAESVKPFRGFWQCDLSDASQETIRCELRSAGYVWKGAKLKARDDDPQRVCRLAEIRAVIDYTAFGRFLLV